MLESGDMLIVAGEWEVVDHDQVGALACFERADLGGGARTSLSWPVPLPTDVVTGQYALPTERGLPGGN